MANKPQILATFKKGRSIGAVNNFVDTMNWLVGFVANLKTDTGIEIKNQQSDHPTIKAKVVAGDGIKVEESGGAWKISVKKDDDDDNDSTKNQNGSKKGSGGSGNGGSSGVGGSGGNGGGQGGGASGGATGGTTGNGNGDGEGSGDKSSDCNQFSEDLENADGDSGMGNDGDNCEELNGW